MDGKAHSPSLRLLIAAGLAACALACAGEAAFTQMGTIMIPIETMTAGSVPADFAFARTGQGGPAQWVVVSDPSASGALAIEQSSTDRTDYRFPLAIYQPVSAKNVEVALRFKLVAGKIDQAGGIAVRVSSANDYYVVRANALEDNVRFYRVTNGRREQIAGADIKVASGEWHTLGLKADNDRFTISYDGKTLYSASDGTLSDAGRVALWTKSDSVTRFDRISIQILP